MPTDHPHDPGVRAGVHTSPDGHAPTRVEADVTSPLGRHDVAAVVAAVAGQPLVWRGLLGLGIGMAILVSPDVGTIAIRLAGVGGILLAGSHLLDARQGGRRPGWSHLALHVVAPAGLGLWVALQPRTSFAAITQVVGIVVLAWGVRRLLRLRQRHTVGRGRTEAIAAGITWIGLGILLTAFPLQIVRGALLALALASGGVAAITAATAAQGLPIPATIGATVAEWLDTRPSARQTQRELVSRLYIEGDDAFSQFVRFAMLMGTSSGIAAMAIVTDSTAVVVGAMLIAPLMVPLLGTSLSLAIGWPNRLVRAAGTVGVGMTVAICTGALVNATTPGTLDLVANSQVASRIFPTLLDLTIAVLAGTAGAYAVSRADVADSLPGVAIAIALVPPLVLTGMLWQQGNWEAGNGALLLYTTNAVAIVLVGGVTFVVTGTAPRDQAAASGQRLRTVLTSAVALAVLVVVALAVNGAQIANAGAEQGAAERAVADWIGDDPDVQSQDVRIDGSTVVVVISAPAITLDAAALQADLVTALERPVRLDLRRTLQERIVVDG